MTPHQWMCFPKGSAMMYVRREAQAGLEPAVLSHGFGAGFLSNFVWDGCRDYSPVLILPMALAWWRWVGLERARRYSSDLLAWAVRHLTAAWASDTLVPLGMCGFMALVALPDAAVPGGGGNAWGAATSAHAKTVQDALHYAHRVECPVKCIQGRLFVRVSAFIYNDRDDFRRLGDAVLGMAARGGADGGAAGR